METADVGLEVETCDDPDSQLDAVVLDGSIVKLVGEVYRRGQ